MNSQPPSKELDLAERVRDSVGFLGRHSTGLSMSQWDTHSNVILDGANEILRLQQANARLAREAHSWWSALAEVLKKQGREIPHVDSLGDMCICLECVEDRAWVQSHGIPTLEPPPARPDAVPAGEPIWLPKVTDDLYSQFVGETLLDDDGNWTQSTVDLACIFKAQVRASQPPGVRCDCGAHEWPEDCVQIEDSRGRLHTQRGCQPGSIATKYSAAEGECNLGCTKCLRVQKFPHANSSADIRNLAGWHFSTDTGWRCPACSTATKGVG